MGIFLARNALLDIFTNFYEMNIYYLYYSIRLVAIWMLCIMKCGVLCDKTPYGDRNIFSDNSLYDSGESELSDKKSYNNKQDRLEKAVQRRGYSDSDSQYYRHYANPDKFIPRMVDYIDQNPYRDQYEGEAARHSRAGQRNQKEPSRQPNLRRLEERKRYNLRDNDRDAREDDDVNSHLEDGKDDRKYLAVDKILLNDKLVNNMKDLINRYEHQKQNEHSESEGNERYDSYSVGNRKSAVDNERSRDAPDHNVNFDSDYVVRGDDSSQLQNSDRRKLKSNNLDISGRSDEDDSNVNVGRNQLKHIKDKPLRALRKQRIQNSENNEGVPHMKQSELDDLNTVISKIISYKNSHFGRNGDAQRQVNDGRQSVDDNDSTLTGKVVDGPRDNLNEYRRQPNDPSMVSNECEDNIDGIDLYEGNDLMETSHFIWDVKSAVYQLYPDLEDHRRITNEAEDKLIIVKLNKAFVELNSNMLKMYNQRALAEWKYETDLSQASVNVLNSKNTEVSNFNNQVYSRLGELLASHGDVNILPSNLQRQIVHISRRGLSALPLDKFLRLQEIVNEMQTTYSEARVCDFQERSHCHLQLDPDLTDRMATIRKSDELLFYWREWYSATGKRMRHLYPEYVDLMNQAAMLNNFADAGEMWLSSYELVDARRDGERLWRALRPLHAQLHAFARRRLALLYGEALVRPNEPIQAHLLGSIWGHSWSNIYDILAPESQIRNVTADFKSKNFTVKAMAKVAENFYTSLGMPPFSEEFWANSIFENEDGRAMVCHASAWDMFSGDDFRIKMCGHVTEEHMSTMYHEMGHVQYYMQYKKQPVWFREGANPAFHEAIGDTIILSTSAKEFKTKDKDSNEQMTIERLLKIALDKVPFLPFAYVQDLWRWKVFEGQIKPSDYNRMWWKLRSSYEGVAEPISSKRYGAFDPGGKYHVAGNVPYFRYFLAAILHHQFHRGLCEKANRDTINLYACDISRSRKAGNAFKKLMSYGSSVHWTKALKELTGEPLMSADALRQYFQPLYEWLLHENNIHDTNIGWDI